MVDLQLLGTGHGTREQCRLVRLLMAWQQYVQGFEAAHACVGRPLERSFLVGDILGSV